MRQSETLGRMPVLSIMAAILLGGHTAVGQTTPAQAAPTPGASAATAEAGKPQWKPEAAGLTLHMIGNSHIDAVWLWPLAEGDAVVHSTFRSALDRMKEDPELTMTTSSSQFYEWVEASDPAMIAEIRKHVASGRWNLAGGWWVEPDVNVPSGESLIRQGLYGQRTLQRIFGRRAIVGYNPDSFGHTGNLPQILKLQRLPYYVFMRPNALEKPAITQNLFQWQGIDGTRTLTYRIPLFYDDPAAVRNHMERTIDALHGQPERIDMEFFGIGDHGGGPTKENMRSIRQIQTEPGAPKIFYSTPERYFAEVKNKLPADIQVYQGDLQHHSVGTYTAGSAIKKLNRSTEAMLLTAEKFSAIGSAAWGATYPKEEFTKAWQRVLLLQFHDGMSATTLPEHFDAARDAFGRARDIALTATTVSLQRLAWQIPTTDPASKYLVVFNPHAWPVKKEVEYDLGWDANIPAQVEDENGRALPFQWVNATTVVTNRRGLVAEVEVPAMGYRQIRVRRAEQTTPRPAEAPHATEDSLENSHLRLSFSNDGGINLYDKDTKREVFANTSGGMRAVVMDDPSDTWSHHVRAYDKEVGVFQRTGLKILEDGPLRARIRETRSYNASTLTIDWILYAGSSMLDAQVTLDWHEHLKMLKFSYPVNITNPKVTTEIAYGALARTNEGDEDPGQRWIDLTGTGDDQPYGLAVINDAKYGYSVLGNDMRVSIARAAVYAHHEPRVLESGVDYQWMDQGVQTFQMQMLPHTGSWQDTNVVRAAEELVSSTPVVYQGIHPGTRKGSDSFLSVDAQDVIVEAVKESEDGNDLIVRSYETAGRPTKATIHMATPAVTWTGDFHAFEIKTLRIDRHTGKVKETDALED
ncbi:alpha-mannosidase [Terriglobus albidus]|uniref:alpha-mannosidase n=1 Tax=Terriglobus albidus TaxID=1592106 RepID=UPI0021E0ADA6|nr:alpha-mannosidase [Terriglobus albidus]